MDDREEKVRGGRVLKPVSSGPPNYNDTLFGSSSTHAHPGISQTHQHKAPVPLYTFVLPKLMSFSLRVIAPPPCKLHYYTRSTTHA